MWIDLATQPSNIEEICDLVNGHLQLRTFLVRHEITLADLSVYGALKSTFLVMMQSRERVYWRQRLRGKEGKILEGARIGECMEERKERKRSKERDKVERVFFVEM